MKHMPSHMPQASCSFSYYFKTQTNSNILSSHAVHMEA
jgi:hypothetical protein